MTYQNIRAVRHYDCRYILSVEITSSCIISLRMCWMVFSSLSTQIAVITGVTHHLLKCLLVVFVYTKGRKLLNKRTQYGQHLARLFEEKYMFISHIDILQTEIGKRGTSIALLGSVIILFVSSRAINNFAR